MDTTTAFFTSYNVSIVIVEKFAHVNKSATLGCWITFVIVSCILNVLVTSRVIFLYVKQPSSMLGSPKLLVILLCCLLQFVNALPAAVIIHTHRVSDEELESSFTCESLLASEISSFMFSSIVALLVGSVCVVEGVRLQRFVTVSQRMCMVVGVLLTVLSVLYGFVVMIPLFYEKFLEDGCQGDSSFYTIGRKANVKIFYAGEFIVPHSLTFIACAFLMIAFCTRSRGFQSKGITVSFPSSHSDCRERDADGATNATNPNNIKENEPSLSTIPSPVQVPQLNGRMIPQEDTRFPWYALWAAAVSFAFGFVWFFYVYQNLTLSISQRQRLRMSGLLLLSLRGVFLPCCWLLDRDLRVVWGHCRAAHNSTHTAQSHQGGGEVDSMEPV